MKTFLMSLLGTLVALLLFLIVLPMVLIGIFSGMAASNASKMAPKTIVLEIDLREDFADQPASEGLAVVFQQNSFLDILTKLDAAATDDRVKGIYVRASEFGVGSARAEELRSAFLKLKANDKFIIAHSQGMMGSGPSSLRSISAADEIWLQPGADVMVNGVVFETLFMKDLFDNLSVKAEIEQFHEYKNAPNVYKETDYTEPHREAMTTLAEDIWSVSLEDIAADRGFASTGALRTLLESGPLSPADAVEAGLVDGLKWPEGASELAVERAGSKAGLVPIVQYTPPLKGLGAPLIAVIGGEGPIVTGPGEQGLFENSAVFASDRIARAILDAGKNENVRAIVFRVDSPGGSAIASDQIWRAVQRVREDMGKPVVVSMGGVAASGGYYVSAGADAIYANRTTITGSIGVYGGKFAIADGLRRLGINPSSIVVGGEFADAFTTESFSEAERAQLHASLERTYDRFMEIVATGRDMPEDRVREIAKGRVWSGDDAAELNLVSEIGGYMAAIDKARELAGIDAETDVRTQIFPIPENPFEAFGDIFGASAETAEAAARLNAIMSDEKFEAVLQQTFAVQNGETQLRSPIMIER